MTQARDTAAPAAVPAEQADDAYAVLACIGNKQAKAVIPPTARRTVQRQFDVTICALP